MRVVSRVSRAVLGLSVAGLCVPASALEIEGVQNASLDQPRVNAALRVGGELLVAEVEDPIGGGTTQTFNIQAFYDTGASGVLISKETADGLGLLLEAGVVFEDVGVGGTEAFNVSQPVEVLLADFAPDAAVDNVATYTSVYDEVFGPLRAQVNQSLAPAESIPLDVFGMPVFQGLTAVFDARALNVIEGTLDTRLYASGAVPASVPAADFRVQTSYGDFSRFTTTSDPTRPPTLRDNPFIGENPLNALDGISDPTAPLGLRTTHNGVTRRSNWLFDTGAAASLVSEAVAAEHGITVAYEEVFDIFVGGLVERPYLLQDGVRLEGDDTFYLALGGVGGSVTVVGFWLDELALPTIEGEEIVYTRAPVLVADIALLDPVTGEELVLDGVFGMNYLVASAFVDTATSPFPDNITAGAFDFFTFDEPSGVLGLTLNPALIPEPGTLVVLLGLGVAVLRRR